MVGGVLGTLVRAAMIPSLDGCQAAFKYGTYGVIIGLVNGVFTAALAKMNGADLTTQVILGGLGTTASVHYLTTAGVVYGLASKGSMTPAVGVIVLSTMLLKTALNKAHITDVKFIYSGTLVLLSTGAAYLASKA